MPETPMHVFIEDGKLKVYNGNENPVAHVVANVDSTGYEHSHELAFAMACGLVNWYVEVGGDTLEGTLQAIQENVEADAMMKWQGPAVNMEVCIKLMRGSEKVWGHVSHVNEDTGWIRLDGGRAYHISQIGDWFQFTHTH
jgi:hypothetical protein